MGDLMREQMFAQWLISKTLALYMTQDDFREEVNSKVNDGYTFSINGEKMNNFEQTEWKLHMVCVDIARQFTEYYFNDFIADEFEQTENSSEKPNNSTTEDCSMVEEKIYKTYLVQMNSKGAPNFSTACEITECDYHKYCKKRGQTDCAWK